MLPPPGKGASIRIGTRVLLPYWVRPIRAKQILEPHDWPENSRTGVEGFYDFYDPVLESFPDTHYVVHDLLAEEDKVMVYWTLKGTQKGAFMGIPPTNREVAMDGIAIYRVEGHKLKERWVVYDLYRLMEQVKAGAPHQEQQP